MMPDLSPEISLGTGERTPDKPVTGNTEAVM
jgi:hypothetical protein